MRNIALTIVVGCLVWAGCEKQPQGEKVSGPSELGSAAAQTEPVKTQAEQTPAASSEAGQAGDIRVSVRILTVDERDFDALDDLWRYTTSSFVVKPRADIFDESGLRVRMAGGDLTDKVAAVAKRARYVNDREMTLVLANGASSYIKIGTGIAMERFHYLTRWYESADYNFSGAVREFKVTVRRIPDRDLVNVRFVPILSKFLSDGGNKKFEEMTASVTVEPGRSILIGGDRNTPQSLAGALLGYSVQGKEQDTVILVNVSLP